jgi:hypothetical protein
VQANYLARHPWEEELLQSFIPTILVSLLALLIPPILFLIAKRAHTIVTLSALHDCIMTRYYKFLIINVLVFFCIGTAALQSFLVGFAIKEANRNVLHILSDSFPSAGPFYVGWRTSIGHNISSYSFVGSHFYDLHPWRSGACTSYVINSRKCYLTAHLSIHSWGEYESSTTTPIT